MIVLASQSAIRRTLLSGAGVVFTAATSPLNESELQSLLTHLSPHDMAVTLANAKANAVEPPEPADLVIGVDQTFELDGNVLHKPRNKEQAKQHLLSLNGKTHRLHAAYSIFRNRQQVAAHCDTATLTMRQMSDGFINDYLATIPRAVLISVGCYQLEGPGIQLMQNITGDYFTILGLPLLPLLAHLRELGELPA